MPGPDPSKPLTPAEVASLIETHHGLAIASVPAETAAADLANVNRATRALADARYDFWDNPADLARLILGDRR